MRLSVTRSPGLTSLALRSIRSRRSTSDREKVYWPCASASPQNDAVEFLPPREAADVDRPGVASREPLDGSARPRPPQDEDPPAVSPREPDRVGGPTLLSCLDRDHKIRESRLEAVALDEVRGPGVFVGQVFGRDTSALFDDLVANPCR